MRSQFAGLLLVLGVPPCSLQRRYHGLTSDWKEYRPRLTPTKSTSWGILTLSVLRVWGPMTFRGGPLTSRRTRE
jgi:hypothetical protein